ncbi:coiled-coil domain-containing protein 66 isoform X2 [Trichechus manatus latirostris]|uniref:Coiled-coil domain-containing protein 66 isoform X2 n=1 Tax=Trichechus manatus latirostris TaxID=127582 RepID=A0A2Y9QV76_TRIMA|nr:coiled-coil domain-containing protein 66 isoform X2 [Trichechus manatus latirostris]
MNLGDGLKLETELLDGKTKLILSPYEHKSKISVKMGNKTKIAKCPLKTKQTGHILKSTQNTCVRSEKHLQKKRIGSETSLAKGISPATPNMPKTRNTITTSAAKQKPCRNHIAAENMKSNLVCLTQDQLQQILMTVNQGNRPISLTENGTEETSQYSLHFNNIPNQPEDENVMGLLQKTEAVSSVSDENKSVLNKKQETSKQLEQKIATETVWKPADIFSTLGERERDRSLLEAKKAQWRKELDEQVALKKKEKEASEKWNNNPWKKSESDKTVWEKPQILDQSRTSTSSSSAPSPSPSQAVAVQADGHSVVRASQILEEAVPLEPPVSAVKQEQQKKWIGELNKQIEEDRQRKRMEKMIYSKGEERDRWAMHFDSFKGYPGSQSQLSSRSTHKQEYLCVSPDTQELADISSVCTPTNGSQVGPSGERPTARPVRDVAVTDSQKMNFLRSMTALLDPAQIEEQDRRRQKQLEHQKAITAQVEETRRRKQLEEEQRKREEREEERRLAREREAVQRQYEEDILKQKQKEEIMTLKTNELLQTMQRAQELAQRLKQEQRIRELAQKGHDTSRLLKNLGGDTIQMEYNASTNNISNLRHSSDEAGGKMNTCVNYTTSPKKDTGVQTDDLNTGMFSTESHCGSVLEREIIDCPSPEISAEFNGQFNTKKNKQELSQDKGANLENSWHSGHCNQLTRTEKQIRHMKKCLKRPDWNIHKPLRGYIPASEKYPKQLQKQREEKKVRRQMELLHLVERNNLGHLSPNSSSSPEALPTSHQETESRFRWHLVKKEEEPLKINSFSKESRPQSPIPAVKNRTQQTQTNTLHLPLKNSSYERENLISEASQTESSLGISEPSDFIPYVRTNEIYYLNPDAPLSGPSTQDPQYQNSHDGDQEQQQLSESDLVRDPLLNPNLVRNRDRQQAILKGLSELRQGLLQKQKELETNLMPSAANQEENFSSLF